MANIKYLSALLTLLTTSAIAADMTGCCLAMKERFGKRQAFDHDSPGYTPQNTRWTLNAQLMPLCIVKPNSTDDVATILKILGPANCPFSIKSGGHTPWAGANNIDSGVAIDLELLNEATLVEDRSFVRLGSGGTWGNAYNQLNGSGLAFPGGRVKTVGIGGLTLGGGYSWFTPRVGWVADNVVNYEIVLASGEVKNVNNGSNADLFEALKGGGNNFGIVTRFDIAAFEHDQKIYGGYLSSPINATAAALDAFKNFVAEVKYGADTRSLVALEFVLSRNSSNDQILSWMTSTGEITGKSAVLWSYRTYDDSFWPWDDAIRDDVVRWTTLADFPNAIPPVQRVTFATATIKLNTSVNGTLERVHQLSVDIYNEFSHIPDLTWNVQYEPLPRVYVERGMAKGGNIMGLDDFPAQRPLYPADPGHTRVIMLLMPLWKDSQYDDEVNRALETWNDRMQELMNVYDAGHPFQYLNYAAPFQNPLASYGVKKLQRLSEVSKKYDPDQVFQRLVPGGSKLTHD